MDNCSVFLFGRSIHKILREAYKEVYEKNNCALFLFIICAR